MKPGQVIGEVGSVWLAAPLLIQPGEGRTAPHWCLGMPAHSGEEPVPSFYPLAEPVGLWMEETDTATGFSYLTVLFFATKQNGEIPCAIFSWPLGSHPTPKTSTKRSSTPLGTTHTACAQIQLCSAAGANSPACATPAETVASSYSEAAVYTHHRAQQMPSPPWPRTGKLGRPRARYRCSTSNW